MMLDFNQPIENMYGIALKESAPDPDNPGKNVEQDVTLRAISVNSLLASEQGADGKVKMLRYDLAMRIHKSNGSADVNVKELALLQKLIGKHMSTLVAGQAIPMLEGEKTKAKG